MNIKIKNNIKVTTNIVFKKQKGGIACMNLNNVDIKEFGKGLLQNEKLSNFANEFIKELGKYLEAKIGKEGINMSIENKYSDYWKYQNFIEDNVSARNRTFKIWE